MNPFEILGELNTTTANNWADIGEGSYNSFMINRGLSYHLDTVMLANEMSKSYKHLPKQMQYDFYRLAIQPKKKRFSKWSKPEESKDLELIMEAYQVTRRKAQTLLSVLNSTAIATIKDTMTKGGR